MPQQNQLPNDGLARRMPIGLAEMTGPQGALLSDEVNGEDKIAVVYDHGAPPPEITISQTAGNVQTVLANGVAVAIVACADGPDLSAEDVILVERFGA